MKEFNLEEAKHGKALCTRDGRKARILCFDIKGSERPILALVLNDNGNEEVYKLRLNGRYYDEITESGVDLMMVEKKKRENKTNGEKARELAILYSQEVDDNGVEVYSVAVECACNEMARWKDEQFAKETKWIDVEDKLPHFVTTESGIRRSKPVLCKMKSGEYCVARCFRYKTNPCFWQNDNYEKLKVKFWREINE